MPLNSRTPIQFAFSTVRLVGRLRGTATSLRITAVSSMRPKRVIFAETLTSFSFARRPIIWVAVAATLSACGGGGGGESAPVNRDASLTFRAYAAEHPTDPAPNASLQLTDAARAEVAKLSRQWSVATLVTRDPLFPDNAVAVSPPYFARTEAVAAAAAGTTLSQLRQAVPAPSSGSVTAALMHGISRTIYAKTEFPVAPSFMDAVTARGQAGTWSTLLLKPVSDAAAIAEPNLRFLITDDYSKQVTWSQAQTIDGVFETDGGIRVQAPMVRLLGARRLPFDGADVAALALPQGDWLVRITPMAGLRALSADDLDRALASTAAAIASQATQTPTTIDLVLPLNPTLRPLGTDDRRGMAEAQDRVRADLRGMDGIGGNYAVLSDDYASLIIESTGMAVWGVSATRFNYSPENWWTGSGFGTVGLPVVESPRCTTTDLRPSYLALINRYSSVVMLARVTTLNGLACQ